MLTRFQILWAQVRDSLWFIPGAFTLAAAGLAFTLVAIEQQGLLAETLQRSWIFDGGVEGARGVLGAIAGGLITVTGVVFSVTIVALQLASSQFTPRVLRSFTADRANQVVLGVFIATFTYALLVLRTIRSAEEGVDPFVPRLAVAVAVVLVLVSVAFLIFFINHSARSIQISTILERITDETLQDIERLFPETMGDPDPAGAEWGRANEIATVAAGKAGYLQAVDAESLFDLGERKRLAIRMEVHIGEFVLPKGILVSVWPGEKLDEEVVDGVSRAFVIGPERTPEQDVEFGIIEIADIAVKALSPSINDPTTALRCIDRLGEILLALGTRYPPREMRTREGHVHFLVRYVPFERAVGLAFDQVRHYGAGNPTVAKKLLDMLARLVALMPESRRRPLVAQAEAVLETTRATSESPADVARVEGMVERIRL